MHLDPSNIILSFTRRSFKEWKPHVCSLYMNSLYFHPFLSNVYSSPVLCYCHFNCRNDNMVQLRKSEMLERTLRFFRCVLNFCIPPPPPPSLSFRRLIIYLLHLTCNAVWCSIQRRDSLSFSLSPRYVTASQVRGRK